MNKNIVIGCGIGVITGVAIGGILALLFAPESGKATRQMIGNKTGEAVKSVEEKSGAVIDTVKQAASEINRKGQAAAFAINH